MSVNADEGERGGRDRGAIRGRFPGRQADLTDAERNPTVTVRGRESMPAVMG